MENKKTYKLVTFIIVVIILIDQLIKIILSPKLNNNLTANILGNIAADTLVIILILKFIMTQKGNMSKITEISLAFIVGGGISNLIDLIFKKEIIRCINISSFLEKLPLFNLADIFIVIGFIIFVVVVGINLVKMRKEK